MNPTLEKRLLQLLDRQEIHDRLMRYARGVDRVDPELMSQAFHPDGVDDHGSFVARGSEVADLFPALMNQHSDASMHFIGNELIEIDGDTARSEAYFLSLGRVDRASGPALKSAGARYVDRWQRRDGAWRIAHRTVVYEWTRVDAIGEVYPNADRLHYGRRDREDPVYRATDP